MQDQDHWIDKTLQVLLIGVGFILTLSQTKFNFIGIFLFLLGLALIILALDWRYIR